MSNSFNYTDSVDPVTGAGGKPSEAVECLYYNANTKELLVGLIESEKAYVYTGVPTHVFVAFKNAVSKGFFYSKIVKTQYGPGEPVGFTDEVVYRDVSVTPAQAGTPKGLTTNENTKVSTNVLAFPLKTEPSVAYATVSTSAPEVKFDDAVSTTVVFNMGGNDATTDFNDKTTVSEAVAEISRLADMLGLGKALTIKSVTVHFE